MNENKKGQEPLPTPTGLAEEESVTELLRVWATPKGKIYGSWADSIAAGHGGLGGLLGAVAQMITVTGNEESAPETLRVVTRDFLAAAARAPSRFPSHFPKLFDYNEIVNAFHGETDRAAGILAAAWLDSYLGQCLRYFLVHDEKENERLVGSETMMERPLSPFRVRGQALYLLGLISKDAFRDVEFIAKVRNRFAHHPGVLSFCDETIRNWCKELRSSKRNMAREARETYLFSISWLVVELNNTMLLTHPRDQAE